MNVDHAQSDSHAPPLAKFPVLALLRPHQWIKNGFVAAPLFFTPSAVNAASVATVAAGVVAFCLASSAIYVVNDYLDRESDRHHAEKRYRPLAAGTISPALAAALLVALLVAALGLAFALSAVFAGFVIGYVALNIAYCLVLKRIAIVDVLTITVGFVLRIYGGAVLIDIVPTPWIVVCAGLLALFMALAKRRDDLERALDGDHRASLAGYTKPFLDTAIGVVVTALLIAYLIYTTDSEVTRRLGTDRLYLTTLFVVGGVLRYLQITLVEKRSGAPTRLVLGDRFLKLAVAGWLATFGALIYG